ncbi:MAG: GIY-YIG nuclease family protein [Saprospiraceae bacterium]|nr:GIY-YIG nuclease family protein [Saprospiraceae bacterium]
MYYVYIIYSSETDRYYKGITQNVEKRVAEHNKRAVEIHQRQGALGVGVFESCGR